MHVATVYAGGIRRRQVGGGIFFVKTRQFGNSHLHPAVAYQITTTIAHHGRQLPTGQTFTCRSQMMTTGSCASATSEHGPPCCAAVNEQLTPRAGRKWPFWLHRFRCRLPLPPRPHLQASAGVWPAVAGRHVDAANGANIAAAGAPRPHPPSRLQPLGVSHPSGHAKSHTNVRNSRIHFISFILHCTSLHAVNTLQAANYSQLFKSRRRYVIADGLRPHWRHQAIRAAGV